MWHVIDVFGFTWAIGESKEEAYMMLSAIKAATKRRGYDFEFEITRA